MCYINDWKDNVKCWKVVLVEVKILLQFINGFLDLVLGWYLVEYC